MKKHNFEEFPTATIVRQLKWSTLEGAIGRFHGGFPAFRRILDERQGIKPPHQQLEDIMEEYVG